MWQAMKNVETGVVHAVELPAGMSPHGYAMDWPMAKIEAPLTCHLCLQFAYRCCWRDENLAAMLPKQATPERRCEICNAPVSRCCC
jgi:hypothetical protein